MEPYSLEEKTAVFLWFSLFIFCLFFIVVTYESIGRCLAHLMRVFAANYTIVSYKSTRQWSSFFVNTIQMHEKFYSFWKGNFNFSVSVSVSVYFANFRKWNYFYEWKFIAFLTVTIPHCTGEPKSSEKTPSMGGVSYLL